MPVSGVSFAYHTMYQHDLIVQVIIHIADIQTLSAAVLLWSRYGGGRGWDVARVWGGQVVDVAVVEASVVSCCCSKGAKRCQ